MAILSLFDWFSLLSFLKESSWSESKIIVYDWENSFLITQIMLFQPDIASILVYYGYYLFFFSKNQTHNI